MLSNLFSAEVLQETIEIVKGQFALAFWETLYVTVAAMFFAVLLGLPLGVLLVVGEKNGLAPLPGWLMKTLNIIINFVVAEFRTDCSFSQDCTKRRISFIPQFRIISVRKLRNRPFRPARIFCFSRHCVTAV